jgi:hypothetical protein
MDEMSREESISPINLPLEIVYCSTTLSNNILISLDRFIS